MTEFRHPTKGYVFVVTYGRSGSTLLQNLLNTLPDCLVRGENNNALFPLYRSWRSLTNSPDIDRMRAAHDTSGPSHPWFGAEMIDTDSYARSLCKSFARHVLRPPPHIRLCGFKEIRTIRPKAEFMGFLQFMNSYFPKAHFVFNTRNHADVVRSSWWRQHDPEEVRQMMAAAERVFADFAKANPERSVCLHYDDYIRDHTLFEPLFDLLDARPPPERMQAVLGTHLSHST